MMSVKAAEDPKEVLQALWPRLQALAVEPVRDETDFVERCAFQETAFLAQWAVRGLSLKPNDVVPGWDEHFVALVRENGRASNALEKSRSVEGQLERKRLEYALASQPLVLPPPEMAIRNFGAEVPLAPVHHAPVQSVKYARLKMSEVLTRFVATQRSQGFDGRVESEVAPIVNFVISLLGDPVMLEINGDHLLTIKREVAEIPLPKGFGQDERSLYFRWSTAKENGWVRQRDEKTVQLKRVSQTTLDGKYTPGLTAFWKFAIEHSFAFGPVPSFEFGTKLNRPAAERDAYNEEEVLTFFGAPPFTGCKSIAHCWNAGPQYIQGYFFWANLIELLGGMRPSEIAQLRCRDILDFRGEPHFRYAPFAPEETEKQRFDPQPGGTRGKTKSAYRWIAIHRLLLKLGIIEHRDAIVSAYRQAKINEAGGASKLSEEQLGAIEDAAYEQWLFPDWKVYIRPKTEQIMWSHVLTKACTYGLKKLKIHRPGLSNYSARHAFKGMIDDVQGLSERSRKVIFGHSTKTNVSDGYGPKVITEQQAKIVQQLTNRTIWRLAKLLLRAKRKAERGELQVVEAWRIDKRSLDERLRAVLAKRAEQYQ
jgi:integrase